jgi:hypothetical protein
MLSVLPERDQFRNRHEAKALAFQFFDDDPRRFDIRAAIADTRLQMMGAAQLSAIAVV